MALFVAVVAVGGLFAGPLGAIAAAVLFVVILGAAYYD
jgi:hypothetical protein